MQNVSVVQTVVCSLLYLPSQALDTDDSCTLSYAELRVGLRKLRQEPCRSACPQHCSGSFATQKIPRTVTLALLCPPTAPTHTYTTRVKPKIHLSEDDFDILTQVICLVQPP
jgi:hypothetical protein